MVQKIPLKYEKVPHCLLMTLLFPSIIDATNIQEDGKMRVSSQQTGRIIYFYGVEE